jgi:phosphatidate phosphatase PAH1
LHRFDLARVWLRAWQVVVHVNGERVDVMMKIGDAGEAFFVFETMVRAHTHEWPQRLHGRA